MERKENFVDSVQNMWALVLYCVNLACSHLLWHSFFTLCRYFIQIQTEDKSTKCLCICSRMGFRQNQMFLLREKKRCWLLSRTCFSTCLRSQHDRGREYLILRNIQGSYYPFIHYQVIHYKNPSMALGEPSDF